MGNIKEARQHVKCSSCGATPGNYCLSLSGSGKKVANNHMPRIHQYLKEKEEADFVALHFTIKVNAQEIGRVYIRRRNPTIVIGQPSDYDYEVELRSQGKTGRVTHKYNEGPLALISKVLSDVLK